MLMKLARFFLGILVEKWPRPSKQARAVKRFIRLVSDVIERVDEVDLDATVRKEGPRARVGESGRDDSVTRNDWPVAWEAVGK